MTRRYLLASGVVVGAAALLGGGCQLYNGAFTAKTRSELDNAAPTAANSTDGSSQYNTNPSAAQVQFDGPNGLGRTAATAGDAQFRLAANADRSMQPFNLYGQLPERVPARSSPMDGSDNLRQVSFATEGADFDPSVDPTGTLLVFASTRHRPTADIYVQKIGGTAVTQLTSDPANDVMPTFSPDGKKVAFASDRAGAWNLYLMDVNGGQVQQLTSDSTQDVHPSFSPDGKHIVYCSYGAKSGQWELVVIDVENPANKRFIGYGLFPSWSPVDNRIVFQKSRERGTRWFSIWTIEYQNGEGSKPTQIAASSNAAAINPQWSPDGKQIVFCTVFNPEDGTTSGSNPTAAATAAAKPTQADIWVTSADGTGRTNLTHSKFLSVQPVWARDGAIYFVSNRAKDGVENIWSTQADRASQTPGSTVAGAARGNPSGGDKSSNKEAPTEHTAAVPTDDK